MLKIQIKKSLIPTAAIEEDVVAKVWNNLLERSDLGFLKLPQNSSDWETFQKLGIEIRSQFEFLIVIGIGGSSLGAESLIKSLAPHGRNKVLFIDNYDLDEITMKLSGVNLAKAAFYVVSKSGNSLFTLSLTDFVISRLIEQNINWKKAFWVCTESRPSPLSNWAVANELPRLEVPLNVGGRFSVFTASGLVPLAFAGCDLEGLRQGALNGLSNSQSIVAAAQFYFSCFQKNQSISYIWFYSSMLRGFSPWLIQLWAESLGKIGSKAGVPVCGLGTIDQHSMLQQISEGEYPRNITLFHVNSLESFDVGPIGKSQFSPFAYWENTSLGRIMKAEFEGTQTALVERKIPVLTLLMDDQKATDLGELVVFFECVIALLAAMLKINAFDQPGVERSKEITQQILR